MGELVLCKVKKISQFAAWCSIDEYPNLDGMIHISEVTGKWVRDIKKYVKMDKKYVAKVIRVDESNNFVNLSLKRVSKTDEREKMNEYRGEQKAESILAQTAKEMNKTLDQAYQEIGFLLREEFGTLFEAFDEIRKSPEILTESKIPKEWTDALLSTMQKIWVEKEIELKVDLELKSYAGDGIEKIKKLLDGIEIPGISVKYISTPKYLIELKTKNPKQDEKKLTKELEKLVEQAKELKVEVNYKFIK